jgi:hypothetical protein
MKSVMDAIALCGSSRILSRHPVTPGFSGCPWYHFRTQSDFMSFHWTAVLRPRFPLSLLCPQVADGCIIICHGCLYSCTNSMNCNLGEGVFRVHIRLQVSPNCAVVRGNLPRYGSSTSTAVTYKRWLWPWSPQLLTRFSPCFIRMCNPVHCY